MGADKARLVVNGEALFVRTARTLGSVSDEVLLASGPGVASSDAAEAARSSGSARFGSTPWRQLRDAKSEFEPDAHANEPRSGPLAAIVAALEFAAAGGWRGVLIAPVDCPRLEPLVLTPLQHLVDTGAAEVAHWRRSADGAGASDRMVAEPLVAALASVIAPKLRAAFERGVRRPTDAYACVNAVTLDLPRDRYGMLVNVNTQGDFEAVLGGRN